MAMERPAPPRSSAATTTTTTTNGIILGKYRLGRLLGRGSFAKVYQAQSLSNNTTVAIKVIDKAKTVDASMEPRIVREIAAMRRLSHHSNILQIHEVMATKTKIYLVMDLAAGGDLSTALSRRRRRHLPESAARRYFQQLVSALHFCHRQGVTHRDIKPQNLLLDSSGTLKISDFGLAALPENRENLLHTACGTPAFAAPEVVRRGGGYDGAKADAWSCGVILFLFLAGNLPFDDSNLAAMFQKICRREFQFPDWISKQSKFIIYRLLDPNPNSRMTLETLIDHSWFKKSLQLDPSAQNPPPQFTKFKVKGETMNAFDIISMSSGLDLSGLFEPSSSSERERRFTAKATEAAVEERVGEVGERLGYRVDREKDRSVGLLKGSVVLEFEIMVVAEGLVMVVVMVVGGGFEEVNWEDLRVGFGDIALDWHNEGS
ncbi:CBL-interacting serine/threonine-protein kinase [Actinidia chinensis var. chinensis]|uniref:non-specific serine/threonine protein kinase n=1 Tax=Actinidia chinensis var. chinensis TaxID=1590841 RepID=A0A2R6RUW2_ACTCC|nr:CBL-interacting serine/threonine-protein kinase [Actinidia chinensis var. chinensis]